MAPPAAPRSALLQASVQHVVALAESASDRVRLALETRAQAAARPADRDLVQRALTALQRQRAAFLQAFADALRSNTGGAAPAARRDAPQSWQSLSLVDDREVEQRLSVDRVAQQIAQRCETQLRDLGNYMGTLLGTGRADEDRHPLNPERVGEALSTAVQAISAEADVRDLLMREFAASVAQAMPTCYDTVIAELEESGVQPLGWRATVGRSGHETVSGGDGRASTSLARASAFDTSAASGPGRRGGGPTSAAPLGGRAIGGNSTHAAALASAADAELMSLLRRLNDLARREFDHDELATLSAHGAPAMQTVAHGDVDGDAAGVPSLMGVNLIRAHRQQLQQAMPAKLDHMVIDVVGSLFDQILSDPRVPPQMARQIGRLQLPVLRVALVDAGFFSSRRHPVRRFVNRIASLACPFDDFEHGPGKAFLDRVRELVQEIVDGDFEQPELYTAKLGALEEFVASQHRAEPAAQAAAELVDARESELRIQQRYMKQLGAALAKVPMDDYLRDFVAQVWSQALVSTVRAEGAQSPQAQRMRQVAVELVMSVQPKGLPLLRKRFLMQLPALMRDLNAGMQLIGWPADAQKEFFGRLLPSHAESLKARPMNELDFNLLGKQVEAVLAAPIPISDTPESYPPLDGVTTSSGAELEPQLSAADAERVGMLQEGAVDWARPVEAEFEGEVDIDLSGEPTAPGAGDADDQVRAPVAAATASAALEFPTLATDSTGWPPVSAPPLDRPDPPEPPPNTPPRRPTELDLDLSLATPDPTEPSRGPKLIDHVRVGFAYEMHLHDAWQKMRLSHVSPGRAFFVFTRGQRHQETVSLTARMLRRLCDANRFRGVENAYLLERATARARQQLASLKSRY